MERGQCASTQAQTLEENTDLAEAKSVLFLREAL
jgi:hypothetical protein